MNILSCYPLPGISYTHDAAACIVGDDGVRFAGEEERYLRSQHGIGHFPERAVMMAFQQTGLQPHDITHLATVSMERCRRQADYQRRLRFARETAFVPDRVPAICVPHHLAHSVLSVLTSPFDSCVFLTLDAGGDGSCGEWGTFNGRRFRIQQKCKLSPAIFYSYLTSLCGFAAFDEGKVMGLAAYGRINERLARYFASHFRIAADGFSMESDLAMRWEGALDRSRINPDAFPRNKYLRWYLHFDGGETTEWFGDIGIEDVARTGQQHFQSLIGEIVHRIVGLSGVTKVACCGGAFLNVVAADQLRRQYPRVSFHFPIAPHDAGLALGAGLWLRHLAGLPRLPSPLTPYLGAVFSTEAVESVLREYQLPYSRPDQYEDAVAALIEEGRIVGWFDGRAEFGARALGARSVLGDPRRPDIKGRLNHLLKKRDWFMPFAPSMLEEDGPSYFPEFMRSPYMNLAQQMLPESAARVPAAVHVDGSCRAHTVSAQEPSRYREVLRAFRRRTGIPVVLNTSFNRHGLPMVATPRQAIQLLLEGCVDVLAIEGLLVERPAGPITDPVPSEADQLKTLNREWASRRGVCEKQF